MRVVFLGLVQELPQRFVADRLVFLESDVTVSHAVSIGPGPITRELSLPPFLIHLTPTKRSEKGVTRCDGVL